MWAAMRGDLAMSWRYNPIGIPLLLGAAATLLRFLVGMATGRWLNVHVRSVTPLAVTGGALFGLLAVNQQLHVELLRTPGEEFSLVGPLLNMLPILVLCAVLVIRNRRIARRAAGR